ncbi:hypothetical protein BDK51DRAFT_38873 [Blyttiomyces helicus]|uniref:Uncharacterized protein n=1 Tax=Blyttiomyces helicus TaxID=388810 RepID=A0A4V1IS48_9FUNG|nr:hypothetical protein BDK51DRAFT_38873 [Blyttiomyces helicus]|eukprot:RKO92307.1 hypothetical protein BDK51DRAFT_38873 [Blyttiomyces helicus]
MNSCSDNFGCCVAAQAVLEVTTTLLRDLRQKMNPNPSSLTLALRLGRRWLEMFPAQAASASTVDEVLRTIMWSAWLMPFSDRRTLPLACCRVSKAWYHLARETLLADLEYSEPSRFPMLALARLASDTLMREPDRRLLPTRRLHFDFASFPVPLMPVLRLALPMLANLRVLEIATYNHSIGASPMTLAPIATILGTCPRLVGLIWKHANIIFDSSLESSVGNEIWAAIDGPLKKLALQAIGPPIRRWVVTGHEDLSSLEPTAAQNLEYLAIQGWLSESPSPKMRTSFFASLATRAPSLRKVRFLCDNLTNDEESIIELINSFPGIEELDLAYQFNLTDAALAPLHNHRPLKVLGIDLTSFSAPSVVALLAARGSILESFDISETAWPTHESVHSLARHTPKLSVPLLFDDCPNLPSTHSTIDQLRASFPSFAVRRPVASGPRRAAGRHQGISGRRGNVSCVGALGCQGDGDPADCGDPLTLLTAVGGLLSEFHSGLIFGRRRAWGDRGLVLRHWIVTECAKRGVGMGGEGGGVGRSQRC